MLVLDETLYLTFDSKIRTFCGELLDIKLYTHDIRKHPERHPRLKQVAPQCTRDVRMTHLVMIM